jgi:hypothetical protein
MPFCECKYVRLTAMLKQKTGEAVICGYPERDSEDWDTFVDPPVWHEVEAHHQGSPVQIVERTQGDFGINDNTDAGFEGCESPSVTVTPGGDGDWSFQYSGASITLGAALDAVEGYAVEGDEVEAEGVSYYALEDRDWGEQADWWQMRAGPAEDIFTVGANHSSSGGEPGLVSYSSTKVRFRRKYSRVPVKFVCSVQHYDDFAQSVPSGAAVETELVIGGESEYSDELEVKVDRLAFPAAKSCVMTFQIRVPSY